MSGSFPGEALVMPGQVKATLTITDIESSKKQRRELRRED